MIYLPSAAVVHFCLSALDTFEDLQSRYFYALLASCRTGRTELSTVYYSTFVNRKKKFDIDVTSLGILVRFRYTFWPMDHRNQMVFLSFFVLCCSGPIFSQERTVPETYLRLEDLARAARLRGETATSPSRIVSRDYPIVNSLEDALRISTPLLVRVASKAIAVTPHGDRLLTWYKAEIVENLSDASLPDVNIASDIGLAPPQSLGSSDTGSFFIRNQGGSTVVDGITIRERELPETLQVGNCYLLFVRFDDNQDGRPTRLATLLLGDASIFGYDVSSGQLTALAKMDNLRFAQVVISRAGASVSRLRGLVKSVATGSAAQ